MMPHSQIDNLDKEILDILMRDATIPYTDIAKQLKVSSGTVHVRMKKLMQLGIVRSVNLHVNPEQLGFGITAFLGIYLEKSSMYDIVVQELKAIAEIVECYYLTGTYSIFVKMHCRDATHLKDVLHDKLQKIAGIDRTETFIALDQTFIRPMVI